MPFDFLKYSYPRLSSLIQTMRLSISAWSKRDPTIVGGNYEVMRPEIGSRVEAEDQALNLYLRTVLELKPHTFVEIGAMGGSRILSLKRMLDTVHATAMDIVALYDQPFEFGGVSFRKFDDVALANFAAGTLVVARGTLCCFNPDAVNHYLAARARDGHNLVVIEPAPLYKIDASAFRGGGSWYHPWEVLLKQHGFTGVRDTNESTKFAGMPGMMESWYSTVAHAPSRTVSF